MDEGRDEMRLDWKMTVRGLDEVARSQPPDLIRKLNL
jgi:hypothetical protein